MRPAPAAPIRASGRAFLASGKGCVPRSRRHTKRPPPIAGRGSCFGANDQAKWKPRQPDHPMPERSGTLGRHPLCLTHTRHALTCVGLYSRRTDFPGQVRKPRRKKRRPGPRRVRGATQTRRRTGGVCAAAAFSSSSNPTCRWSAIPRSRNRSNPWCCRKHCRSPRRCCRPKPGWRAACATPRTCC